MTLEQRVEALEKEVAALKGSVSKLPSEIVFPDNLAKELKELISPKSSASHDSSVEFQK